MNACCPHYSLWTPGRWEQVCGPGIGIDSEFEQWVDDEPPMTMPACSGVLP